MGSSSTPLPNETRSRRRRSGLANGVEACSDPLLSEQVARSVIAFKAASSFHRFCADCKQGNELYRFYDTLPDMA